MQPLIIAFLQHLIQTAPDVVLAKGKVTTTAIQRQALENMTNKEVANTLVENKVRSYNDKLNIKKKHLIFIFTEVP